jgi:hypothetical protein
MKRVRQNKRRRPTAPRPMPRIARAPNQPAVTPESVGVLRFIALRLRTFADEIDRLVAGIR